MRQGRKPGWGDERGGTLALVAVAMIVILAVAALAIDLAAAFSWRAEAQKIADSASLAGASAFLDEPDTAAARPIANDRAYEYALLHTIKKLPVDSSDVTVEVLSTEEKVRVYVSKQDLPTWFARILGVRSIDIAAVAAAQAFAAGEARCLKPIALPDLWDELNVDEGGQDVNDNDLWDNGEEWDYEEELGDRYEKFSEDATDPTGYGSDFRGNHPDGTSADFGRVVQLKAQNPQSEFNFEPGLFFPWRVPEDPNMGECDSGGGGGSTAGGALYRRNICECNNSPIELNTPYDLEPGNMVGPTRQGINELMAEDTETEWVSTLRPDGRPIGPAVQNEDGSYTPVLSSPRIIKVALMDPGQIVRSGMQSVEFNNFALLFLEGFDGSGNNAPVMARFMFFAGGSGEGSGGPAEGSLVKYLRLVE